MLKVISDLEDSELDGKTVMIRVDYNVSVNSGFVGEDFRIRMTLPTIEYLTKRRSKIVLISHLGRPTDREPQYSLAPVAKRLSEMIGNSKVRFASNCIGNNVHNEIGRMEKGDVLLLENSTRKKSQMNRNFQKSSLHWLIYT